MAQKYQAEPEKLSLAGRIAWGAFEGYLTAVIYALEKLDRLAGPYEPGEPVEKETSFLEEVDKAMSHIFVRRREETRLIENDA